MLTISIQAGGQSRRMGQDKALMPFLGEPLVARLARRLRPYAAQLIVTTNRPEAYQFLGLPLFSDLVPDAGALGGLLTALHAAQTPFVALIACDMPFANGAFLQFGAERLAAASADVFIPRTGHGFEPLHAVYRRETCLPAVEQALQEGKRRVISWFDQVQVIAAEGEILRQFDVEGRMFENVNTPEEFARAEKFAQAQKKSPLG